MVFNGQADGLDPDVPLKPVGSVCLVNICLSSQHSLASHVNASWPCAILWKVYKSLKRKYFGVIIYSIESIPTGEVGVKARGRAIVAACFARADLSALPHTI